MKMSMLDNGMDSLKTGYDYLVIYLKDNSCEESYYTLKHAIILLHHGVEILAKHILSKENEFLLFSSFDGKTKKAFEEKKSLNLNSVFDGDQSINLHTISYLEAIDRIKYLDVIEISDTLYNKFCKLNQLRNQFTHSYVKINDNEISDFLEHFMHLVDEFFIKGLGNEYKHLTNYGKLIGRDKEAVELLIKRGHEYKKIVIEALHKTADELGIILTDTVTIFEDPKIAQKYIDSMTLKLMKHCERQTIWGFDLFNGYNSGNADIYSLCDSLFVFHGADITGRYVFEFDKMYLFLPNISTDESPILLFTSCYYKNEGQLKNEYWTLKYQSVRAYRGLYDVNDDRHYLDLSLFNESGYTLDDVFDEDTGRISEEFYDSFEPIILFSEEKLFAYVNFQGLFNVHFRNAFSQCARFGVNKFIEILSSSYEKDD